MRRTHVTEQMIDPVIGRRIFTLCWFCAGLGVSILQMQLLAQAWSVTSASTRASMYRERLGAWLTRWYRVDAPRHACGEAVSSHAPCSGLLAHGWCRGALAWYRQRG